MAKTSKIAKNKKSLLKFEERYRNRCGNCGRPRGFIRFVGLCRLCFRKFANDGQIPGVTKASW